MDAVTTITSWIVRTPDSAVLTAAVSVAIIYLTADAVRSRHQPVSARLLPISVALATGLSAEGMWVTAGQVFHLSGLIRVGLFAFGEVALLAAASMAGEANRELLALASQAPACEDEAKIRESRRRSALRRARYFTGAVWGIAIVVGILAGAASTSRAEQVGRLVPPILVALFWFGRLDRSGIAVTRESITSRLSVRRLLVRLGWAKPGTETLAQADRARRLERLAQRLYVYHCASSGSLHQRYARWRAVRAESGAVRYLDRPGRAWVAGQLSARYTLLSGTSPASLSAVSPWDVDRLGGQDSLTGQSSVITGQVVERTADSPAVSVVDSVVDSPAVSGQSSGQRTAVDSPAVSGQLTGQLTGRVVTRRVGPVDRTADSGQRTAADSGQRSAGVEAMAVWLVQAFPGGIPGRPTVRPVLAREFGSCSNDRARDVIVAARSRCNGSREVNQ